MCVIAAFQQRLPPIGRLLHLQSLHVCLLALHVVGHNCICIQTAQNMSQWFKRRQRRLNDKRQSKNLLMKTISTFRHHLLCRGYPKSFVDPLLSTVPYSLRNNFFLPLTSTSPLALISHLTPSPPDSSLLTPPHLYQTLTHHWDLISKDTNLKQLFSPPQCCFK